MFQFSSVVFWSKSTRIPTDVSFFCTGVNISLSHLVHARSLCHVRQSINSVPVVCHGGRHDRGGGPVGDRGHVDAAAVVEVVPGGVDWRRGY